MNEQISSEVFDFEGHKQRAIEQYQQIRPLYDEFANIVKSLISQALKAHQIIVHSIEARAKTLDSFGKKASTPSFDEPDKPRYPNPLSEIIDLSGVRVITFFPSTQEKVNKVIEDEFDILEKSDKTGLLIKEGKFGYASIHYVLKLKSNRADLLEYKRFKELVAEIQVRTILQHAWAEIEHDIQYKSTETIPALIHRRFLALSGLLEIADREFQAIQDEDEKLRKQARESIKEDNLENVEITGDALKAYLNKKLGSDRRVSSYSYEYTARKLRKLGFTNFKQIEECINGIDHDRVSRILFGTRLGQIWRFEYQLFAGMGENFIKLHPRGNNEVFVCARRAMMEDLKNAGIKVGSYSPKG